MLGLEADAQGADISASGTVSTSVPPFFSFTTTAEQKLDMLGTVRARLGLTPIAPVLVYATGGLAYGHASLSASVTNPSCIGVCSEGSTSSMMAGWTAGGGIEYAFSSHWSLKTEYLYYDLGAISKNISDGRFPGVFQTFSTDVKGNIVRVGVNYKF